MYTENQYTENYTVHRNLNEQRKLDCKQTTELYTGIQNVNRKLNSTQKTSTEKTRLTQKTKLYKED